MDGPSRPAVLNLGEIANLTVLDDDPGSIFGFDTGPANAPLDRLVRRLSNGALACDLDGRFARLGHVNERLLESLLESDLFLKRPPPKSTGFEMYGDGFVARAAEQHSRLDADLMATLTEYSARAVAMAVHHILSRGNGRMERTSGSRECKVRDSRPFGATIRSSQSSPPGRRRTSVRPGSEFSGSRQNIVPKSLFDNSIQIKVGARRNRAFLEKD